MSNARGGMRQTIRAKQSTQPSFDGVLIGIVRTGLRGGIPTARLLIRAEDLAHQVDLAQGQKATIPGHGVLEMLAVEAPTGGDPRGTVELAWDSGEDDQQ